MYAHIQLVTPKSTIVYTMMIVNNEQSTEQKASNNVEWETQRETEREESGKKNKVIRSQID